MGQFLDLLFILDLSSSGLPKSGYKNKIFTYCVDEWHQPHEVACVLLDLRGLGQKFIYHCSEGLSLLLIFAIDLLVKILTICSSTSPMMVQSRDGSGRHFAHIGPWELGSCGLRAGPRVQSQIPNFPTNPALTKCPTNLCRDYCKTLPTHGRYTVTSVLFILFLFLSRCHFSESRVTVAIRASLAGFGLCGLGGLGANRFRTEMFPLQFLPFCSHSIGMEKVHTESSQLRSFAYCSQTSLHLIKSIPTTDQVDLDGRSTCGMYSSMEKTDHQGYQMGISSAKFVIVGIVLPVGREIIVWHTSIILA